ncbi:type I 3-dehydroquinate dehydratase, partial [Staphylococcus equorum]
MKTRIVGSLMPNDVTLTLSEVENVINQQDFIDIVEIRIDEIKDLTIETIEKIIEQLRQKGFRKEVLITFRTESQGGARSIEEAAYQNLLQSIAGIK